MHEKHTRIQKQLQNCHLFAAMLAEDVGPSLAKFKRSAEPAQVAAAWKDLTVNQVSRLHSTPSYLLARYSFSENRVWTCGTLAHPKQCRATAPVGEFCADPRHEQCGQHNSRAPQ